MKMIDLERLKWLKWLVIGFGLVMLIILSFTFGVMANRSKQAKTTNADPTVAKEVKKEPSTQLNQQYVTDFLAAYFTKKELGENRNRYLPYMSEGAYTREVNMEEEPASQAYKGYIVDEKLKDATVYIDDVNQTAIAKVTYSRTKLQRKNDYTNAQTETISNKVLQISYLKSGNKYLVSQIEPIMIMDQLTDSQKAALNAGHTLKVVEEQSTETEQTTEGEQK